jgi:hypothetical protein
VSEATVTDRSSEIAPGVRRFVESHVPSLEHLEVLALLIRTADQWWDAGGVEQELGISPDAGRRILEDLASGNLLEIRVTTDVRYQFRPGEAEVREAAAAFAEAYATQRLAVTRLVARPSNRNIRAFADAFRIQRDDDR